METELFIFDNNQINLISLCPTRELLVRMDVQDPRAHRELVDSLVSWDSQDQKEHL